MSEDLSKYVSYNPEDGSFQAILSTRCRKAGPVAGSVDPKTGYIRIWINGTRYYAHRLALYLSDGVWPSVVDHINRCKTDNRRVNLRAVSNSQNAQNTKLFSTNTSGHRGVSYIEGDGRWRAQITVNRKNIHLGRFESKEQAIASYKAAASKFHSHGHFA